MYKYKLLFSYIYSLDDVKEQELLVKCVIKPKMQVIYARNVYCSRGANLRAVRVRTDGP